MKNTLIRIRALALAVTLNTSVGAGYLMADSPTTTTVRVAHHYEYQNGKYVWCPTYYAEAPKAKDGYSTPEWRSPGSVRHLSGYEAGHWSPSVRTAPDPAKQGVAVR